MSIASTYFPHIHPPPLRSYFAPKPPPTPPSPTRSLLASRSTFLPTPLLETLLNHTPFPPCPPPLSASDQLALDLAYVPPRRPNPKARKVVPRPVPDQLDAKFRTEEHRRVIKWTLIRGLFREFGNRQGRNSSGRVLRDHVKNSNRTSREMGFWGDRRDGTMEGRIQFGWETLELLKRSREKGEGKYLERLRDKVLFQQDAKGLALQKERDRVKPSGGPIPWARPYGGTLTGSIMHPTRLHTALPRIKPQPIHMSMMIARREQEQNEAFKVIQYKTRADSRPTDKALQEEVNSPLFLHHLSLAHTTLREGRARESTPIPPSLVLLCAAARVRSEKYKYTKRQDLYAARWKKTCERRRRVEEGEEKGPFEADERERGGEGEEGVWGVTKEVKEKGGRVEEVLTLEGGKKVGGILWKEEEKEWKEMELRKETYGGWVGSTWGWEGRRLSPSDKP